MRRSHRHVPVILDKDVEGTGFAGELTDVRAGFARNFLIPRGLAKAATPKLKEQREKDIEAAAARRDKETAAREELAAQLQAEPIGLALKVGPGGQVFGSVTATEFAKAVKAQRKLDVDPKQLHGVPISSIGPAQVSARLGLGVSALIPAVVKGTKVAKAGAERTKAATAPSEKEPAEA
ncbi:MAG TPA: 50S ribosomal protein L9 [Patescibacteria group bacterium]|jgi:large subunit ribosomal protein L9